MSETLAIWQKLEKTDPAHTKQFQRSGGFKGTALKPMWVWKRLTEQFGPFGQGWGCSEPKFELVPAGNELLVFCTVSGWHGTHEQAVWGVGGDKVIAATKSGPRADDEAFKKAFTDALMNAFKFLGAGADIHMGMFDDNKYVAAVAKEFADPEQERGTDIPKRAKLEGPYTSKTALWAAFKKFDRELRSCGDVDMLDAFVGTPESQALLKQLERDAPGLARTGEGLPDEFEPVIPLMAKLRSDLLANENTSWTPSVVNAG